MIDTPSNEVGLNSAKPNKALVLSGFASANPAYDSQGISGVVSINELKSLIHTGKMLLLLEDSQLQSGLREEVNGYKNNASDLNAWGNHRIYLDVKTNFSISQVV